MTKCPYCRGTMNEKNKFCSRKCFNAYHGFTEEAPVHKVMRKVGTASTVPEEDLEE